MLTQQAAQSASGKATRCEWVGLAVLALPCVLYATDLTVLNLAIPSLTTDLKPTAAQLLNSRSRIRRARRCSLIASRIWQHGRLVLVRCRRTALRSAVGYLWIMVSAISCALATVIPP